jgi:2-oxoglutarate dehydrogenase complex dehydrogenase (E1) component-like enzyme
MIFKGLRLLAPRFGNNYSQAMYEAWKANPSEVHSDWHEVFNKQEKAPAHVAGNPEHIEREKSLALSAYMLIRYYKMRGHEEAELDPLRTSPMMKDS